MAAFRKSVYKRKVTTFFNNEVDPALAVQHGTAPHLGGAQVIPPDLTHIPKIHLGKIVIRCHGMAAASARPHISMMPHNRRRRVVEIAGAARIDHDAKTAGGSRGWVADTVSFESPTFVLKTAGDNTRSKLEFELLGPGCLFQNESGRTIPPRTKRAYGTRRRGQIANDPAGAADFPDDLHRDIFLADLETVISLKRCFN